MAFVYIFNCMQGQLTSIEALESSNVRFHDSSHFLSPVFVWDSTERGVVFLCTTITGVQGMEHGIDECRREYHAFLRGGGV